MTQRLKGAYTGPLNLRPSMVPLNESFAPSRSKSAIQSYLAGDGGPPGETFLFDPPHRQHFIALWDFTESNQFFRVEKGPLGTAGPSLTRNVIFAALAVVVGGSRSQFWDFSRAPIQIASLWIYVPVLSGPPNTIQFTVGWSR